MTLYFNADEVFEIAERIEDNGAAYYRAAAELMDGPVRALLKELACWEKKHKAIFSELRIKLEAKERESTAFDPYHEAVQYLHALADDKVFARNENPVTELGAHPTSGDILRGALNREYDSITFYAGMKEVVAVRFGREHIEDIIREEMRHVTLLKRELGGENDLGGMITTAG